MHIRMGQPSLEGYNNHTSSHKYIRKIELGCIKSAIERKWLRKRLLFKHSRWLSKIDQRVKHQQQAWSLNKCLRLGIQSNSFKGHGSLVTTPQAHLEHNSTEVFKMTQPILKVKEVRPKSLIKLQMLSKLPKCIHSKANYATRRS